ncbi:MAG: hypothetical protein KGJ11_07240, partial [Candidatus Omnitrophica bacterium]|nr:hypothetical protein [Candidatus Omnitrophota bacterium]
MSDPVPSTNSPWRSVIIVACVGIIAYSNTFFSPFELDDFSSIVNNGCIQNLGDLHGIWHFLPRRFILYLSLAFNYHFNGLNVCGWHLFNLAVHLAAAVLVWRLALLTFSTPVLREDQIARHAPAIALWAGLIFVSHPVQTEAVTYIVQRAASLAAMFYLASLCLYLKARLLQEQGKPAWKSFYAGCLLSTVAAMYTKETAITLPLMIVLCEVSFLRAWKDIDWKQLIPVLLSLLVIPVTMVLTENSPARIHHLCSEPGISPWQYFLTQLRVIVTYIRLLFLPVHQDFDYDYPVFKSFFQTPVLLSFLFLAAVLLGAKRLWPKYRLVSFGIFFFFLALV